MYTGTVLVAHPKGGYRRIHISELDRDRYEPARKVLWGKRRRYWRLKPEPEEMWRCTAGFNGVAQGDYVSVTYMEWSMEEGDYEEFKKHARQYIDSELQSQWGDKYHSEWSVWNGPPNYSKQRVSYDRELLGSNKGEAEPSSDIFAEDRDWRRAYASRMIESGQWWRQETLERWSWIHDES